ncbi:ferredoxin [Nocardia sp. BSTN01]|uniref:ferredoxin n=1 Tax=Nocardia sp. BSTN01 TaxID=2783665 RepID=UPI00188EB300|nr:ferredoxin [Nocardia sp. BSTN01]MBF4999966.1 ferredoxin [Nocardia sp. BSTN01]
MSLTARALGIGRPPSGVLAVDRIACTGHGICAQVLPEKIVPDEWGYPVLTDSEPDAALAIEAIKLCPAAALRWVAPPVR